MCRVIAYRVNRANSGVFFLLNNFHRLCAQSHDNSSEIRDKTRARGRVGTLQEATFDVIP